MTRRSVRAVVGRTLLVARVVALGLTIGRLVGRRRPPPVRRAVPGGAGAGPATGVRGTDEVPGGITVVIPARNEAARLTPCLAALRGAPGVDEIVVVDDQSTDATAALAAGLGARVIAGRPLPPGWAGKAWAIQQGVEAATSDWIVTLDADTRPAPALPTVLRERLQHGLDLLTVAGRFECPSPGSRFLHPAMLTTLVYRFGRPDPEAMSPPRLANGQCMAMRRQPFLAAGGMAPVADRLVEDVALARHLAGRGWRVGFVDGADLLTVRMFDSFLDTWVGWGRSIALPGVESRGRQIIDLAVLVVVQALPLPRMLLRRMDALDAVALAVRAGTLVGTARAYTRRDAAYWASPLADQIAVGRLALSIARPSRSWRGRSYPSSRPRPSSRGA